MQARQRWSDRPGLRNCQQRLENLLLPVHVAARAADSVSVGADADIPVFCAPQIFRSRLAFVSRAADELAAAAREALSDRGVAVAAWARGATPSSGCPAFAGRTGCAGRVPEHGWSWLAAGGHVRASGGCDRQPAPVVPGWPRWAGLPGVWPGGSGPREPVVRQPAGNHDAAAAGLGPLPDSAPGRQIRGARRGFPAGTAPGPWPGSRARLASVAGRVT